jgi:1-acyl-sn-glycerol-3-phosphate acyltransferase
MIRVMPKRHGTWSLGPAYRFAAFVLKPPMTFLTRRDWHGQRYLRDVYPPHDGIVVVSNHLSWFDPIALSHVLWDNGRPPRFLAKEALFHAPLVGPIVSNTGQIPVFRETEVAADSVKAAVEAIHDGEAVVVYPEGTITRDPDLWPMTGRTGAARIALLSGAPVIPIAQWGPQEVMAPYAREFKMIPPKTMHMRVGGPVPLDDLRDEPLSASVLQEATARIMDELTVLLEQIRGEKAPSERLDYREWRQSQNSRQEEK